MSDTPAQPGLDSLSKSFEPAALEAHWGPEWEKRGYGNAGYRGTGKPSLEAAAAGNNFAIQLPPPNVTGTLHMGHAFNQTIMDGLTRHARMAGANTLWVPGTDHAGIATQIVVERQLDAQGVSRHDMGREKFVEKVWEWKEQSGSTITRQVRRMHRVSASLPAVLYLADGRTLQALCTDYSMNGLGLKLQQVEPAQWQPLAPGTPVHVGLWWDDTEYAFPATVMLDPGHAALGLQFDALSRDEQIALVQCTFARPDSWSDWSTEQAEDRPLQGLKEIVLLGVSGYRTLGQALRQSVRDGWTRLNIFSRI